MEKNVGDTDAYLRLACGLTMLGVGVINRSRLTVALGAMKVAEGTTRWCPMLQLLGINTIRKDKGTTPQTVRADAFYTE